MVHGKIKQICLSCKHYRPTDELEGKCRVEKGKIDHLAYPVKQHDDSCDLWQDCGQQYYIRIGWVRSLRSKKEADSRV